MYGHDMTRTGGIGTGLRKIPEGIAIVVPGMMIVMSVVVGKMITGGRTGESAGIVVVIGVAPASNTGKSNDKSTIMLTHL